MLTKSFVERDGGYELRQMRSFPLPLAIYDLLPGTNRAECLLIIAVIRSTLGWQATMPGRRKASAVLTHKLLKEKTGCRSSTTISAAIDGLVRRGLLETLTDDGVVLATSDQRRRYHRPLRFRIPRSLVETKES
jgi:hypothetical protein